MLGGLSLWSLLIQENKTQLQESPKATSPAQIMAYLSPAVALSSFLLMRSAHEVHTWGLPEDGSFSLLLCGPDTLPSPKQMEAKVTCDHPIKHHVFSLAPLPRGTVRSGQHQRPLRNCNKLPRLHQADRAPRMNVRLDTGCSHCLAGPCALGH